MPAPIPALPPVSTSARQGLRAAGDALQAAADEVVSATVHGLNGAGQPPAGPAAAVALSPGGEAALPDLEGGLLDATMARHAYSAAGKLLRADDERQAALLRAVD
jgi:hypothetical protein